MGTVLQCLTKRVVPHRSVVALLLMATAPVPVPSGFEATRAIDARLAAIAYRLQTGNAALCHALAPVPGLALLSAGQYAPGDRAAVDAAFGFTTAVGIEAVVPGSPAAAAGVQPGDSLVAIAAVPVASALPDRASAAGRDAALDLLAQQPVDAPVSLTLRVVGADRIVRIAPSPGCAAIVEVRYGSGLNARADGKRVQVSDRFFQRYDDGIVAAVVAHELAHIVLDHHDRLGAARVSRSLLAAFGRSGKAIRSTEDEADALSVALLYNAGYDPAVAVRLWREHGGEIDGDPLRMPGHAGPGRRARAIETEIARIPDGAPRPYIPAVLASRDKSL